MTPAQRAQLEALDAAETAGRRAEFLAKMGPPPPPPKGKAAKAKAAKAKAAKAPKAKAAKADAAKAVAKAVPPKGA